MLRIFAVFRIKVKWYFWIYNAFQRCPVRSHHMPCIISQMLIFHLPISQWQNQAVFAACLHTHSSEALSNSSKEKSWTIRNRIWWIVVAASCPSGRQLWFGEVSIKNQAPLPILATSIKHLIFPLSSPISLTLVPHSCSWDSFSNYMHISPWLRLYSSPPGSDTVFLKCQVNKGTYTTSISLPFSPPFPTYSYSYKNLYKNVHINYFVITQSRKRTDRKSVV